MELKKIDWTVENEALFIGKIKEFQNHKDGRFLVVEEQSETEKLIDLLISKGILKSTDKIGVMDKVKNHYKKL